MAFCLCEMCQLFYGRRRHIHNLRSVIVITSNFSFPKPPLSTTYPIKRTYPLGSILIRTTLPPTFELTYRKNDTTKRKKEFPPPLSDAHARQLLSAKGGKKCHRVEKKYSTGEGCTRTVVKRKRKMVEKWEKRPRFSTSYEPALCKFFSLLERRRRPSKLRTTHRLPTLLLDVEVQYVLFVNGTDRKSALPRQVVLGLQPRTQSARPRLDEKKSSEPKIKWRYEETKKNRLLFHTNFRRFPLLLVFFSEYLAYKDGWYSITPT